MKERPILFSGEMVRVILDGRKTQTRRVMSFPKNYMWNHEHFKENYTFKKMFFNHLDEYVAIFSCHEKNQQEFTEWFKCPYGKPGDQLWVRETFAVEDTSEYNGEERLPKDGRPIKILNDDDGAEYKLIPRYRTTEPDTFLCVTYDRDTGEDKMAWRPSIFMPRWASRILLEVTGVRVERVQEIDDLGAKAEGIAVLEDDMRAGTYIEPFRLLWNKINAKRGFGWDKNPWVWVVAFKRIEP